MGEGKFEIKVGLSNGLVSGIGESVTSNTLNKIKAAYPELNTTWLLTGEGEMISARKIDRNTISYLEQRRHIKNAPKEVYFPVYNGNARLREDDTLTVYNDNPEEQVPVGFLPQHLFPGCDHAEKATGQSMYPRVANQAVVAGKIIEKHTIVFNELYGLHLKGGSPPVIKWVQQYDDDPQSILLVSENKELRPQKIKLDDVDLVFRILYIINPA